MGCCGSGYWDQQQICWFIVFTAGIVFPCVFSWMYLLLNVSLSEHRSWYQVLGLLPIWRPQSTFFPYLSIKSRGDIFLPTFFHCHPFNSGVLYLLGEEQDQIVLWQGAAQPQTKPKCNCFLFPHMSSLWFWTPLLWKALSFIVLFNYEILSSVIHCDSVTDSTWQRRDCPDWITGRTELAEPHACEPWRSTSSLWRAPRSHPGGDWSSFHLLSPLLPGAAGSPCCDHPRDSPLCDPSPHWGTRTCGGICSWEELWARLSQKQHWHRADTAPTPWDLGPWWHWTCTHPSLGCGGYPPTKVQHKACNGHPGTKDGLGAVIVPPQIHVQLPGFKGKRGWCA